MSSHPRENWLARKNRRSTATGVVPSSTAVSRRQFLSSSAKGLAALGLAGAFGGALTACERPGDADFKVPLARKDHPVTWPIFDDNEPIRSGLPTESGRPTLQIYNWVEYLNTAVVKQFCDAYDCDYQITTFNDMQEAISKFQTGEFSFDIFIPTIDYLGPLIEAKLIQPLNHSYIDNIDQAWTEYLNPFYDQHWRYTIPYTIYTTGISWRKDLVHEDPYKMQNGWAMPWQEKYRGRVAILDDYRESISLALLKMGITDINTTNLDHISDALRELQDLQRLVDVLIDNNDYTEIPDGQTWIHHAWSGDMAAAPYYMPKGVPVDVVGYWFPTDGIGPVGNDLMTIPTSSRNPVLAHHFLNWMLDLKNVLLNISFNGYMQPLKGVTPEVLIEKKLLPKSLETTVVLPSYFDHGLQELELPPVANNAWQLAWTEFGGGL